MNVCIGYVYRFGRKFTSILFHTICAVSLMVATVLLTNAGNSNHSIE